MKKKKRKPTKNKLLVERSVPFIIRDRERELFFPVVELIDPIFDTVLQSARGTAMINDACGGCNVPDIIAGGVARRGLLRQRKMLPGCGCGISIGGVGDGGGGASNGHHHHHHHAVLALRRTGSTTSGYDSSYTRHSPHRNCYMLRSIRDVPRAAPLNTPPTNDNVRGDSQSAYGKNNGLETSQPRGNTMCTTDEQHCT